MVFSSFFKSVVSSSGRHVVSSAALTVSTTSAGGTIVQSIKKVVDKISSDLGIEEKEWQCWCGHKFVAAGQWYPTEACFCEAPGCPNPQFFLSGPGRQMLEARKRGEDVSPQGEEPKEKPKHSMGGRLRK